MTPKDFDTVLVKSEHLQDWYILERKDHPNTSEMVKTEWGGRFKYSGRLDDEGYACVEGTAWEWREVAAAIENGYSESFKRCAAERTEEGYLIYSPRNSNEHRALFSFEAAKRIAAEIRRVV